MAFCQIHDNFPLENTWPTGAYGKSGTSEQPGSAGTANFCKCDHVQATESQITSLL